MKYLLQADWERLVKNAERYEALVALVHKSESTDGRALMGLTYREIGDLCDNELELQADASRRANGDTECKICGRPYRRHPQGGPIGCGDEQFLNRLCDGSLVKL